MQTFDQKGQLGLTGAITNGFPQMSGLGNFSASGAPIGGMTSNFGSTYHQEPDTGEFTSSASLSWVKGSHTFKFGGSMHTRMEGVQPVPGRLGSLCLFRRSDRSTVRAGRRDAGDHQWIARPRLRQLPSRFAEFGDAVAMHQRELARQGPGRIRAGQLESDATAHARAGSAVRLAESAGGRSEPHQLVLADHAQSERRQSAGRRALPGLRAQHLQLRQSSDSLQIRIRAAHRRGVSAHPEDRHPGRLGLLLRRSRHVSPPALLSLPAPERATTRSRSRRHGPAPPRCRTGFRADFPWTRPCSPPRCTSPERFRRRIRLRV